MLSFKKRFGTSSVISDQDSMYMCSLVSVFCSRLFSVNQLTFEIYIIMCQYSDHSFIRVLKVKINLVKLTFLTTISSHQSHKSVGYGKYTTLNMVLFLQLIG